MGACAASARFVIPLFVSESPIRFDLPEALRFVYYIDMRDCFLDAQDCGGSAICPHNKVRASCKVYCSLHYFHSAPDAIC